MSPSGPPDANQTSVAHIFQGTEENIALEEAECDLR